MGLSSLYKPVRHDELVDIGSDAVLGDGSQFAVGAVAARPNGATFNDARKRFFYANDEDKLYRHDGAGAAWVEILLRGAATGTVSAAHVGCKVRKSALQALPTGVTTALTFDVEDYDDGGFHDNITNNNRITVPAGKAGKYIVTAAADIQANAAGLRYIEIRRNGVLVAGTNTSPTGADNTLIQLVTELVLAAGDFIESSVTQTSGAALTVDATVYGTWFSASLIGS